MIHSPKQVAATENLLAGAHKFPQSMALGHKSMNEIFRRYIESLKPSFQKLMNMESVSVVNLPPEIPQSGILLFSEAQLQGQVFDFELWASKSKT